jgi:hypothetical protein
MYHVQQCITRKYKIVLLIITWLHYDVYQLHCVVYELHYVMYVCVECNSAQCFWLCAKRSAAVPSSCHTVNTALLFYTVSSRNK